MSTPPRLRTGAVSVTFGRNRVLRDVGFEVGAGEIHALIGQNGSGKSTLVKVLTGLYVPEPGATVEVDGVPLRLPVRPLEARASGVAVVHQSLGLVGEATVLENMRVGRLRAGRLSRRIHWEHERAQAARMFDRLEHHVPLDTPVHRLSEEDRATVAIARAMQDTPPGGGLIIFDESTRALSRRSLEHFYEMLDGVVRAGTSALLISHRLEEVADVADRVTVLRDGELVEAGLPVTRRGEGELARLMLGRNLAGLSSGGGHARPQDTPAVELTGVAGSRLDGAGVRIAPGEIVGVTGLADSGYQDLPYVLAGVERARGGTLVVAGNPVDLAQFSPMAAIDAGIALVPGDRERAGLAMDQSVAENAALPRTGGRGSRLAPIRRRAELAGLAPWLDRLELSPRDPHAVVSRLSGGNQQKVVLAKWLARAPKVLALHEPTQAVDIGARETIVAAVKDAAAAGCAVLVASGDENELSMLCDRILVFRDGRVSGELTGSPGPDEIVAAVFSSTDRRPLRGHNEERGLVP
ncbi:sugar ABC transporter ATP-binding protein [Winogradskya consettensis]|uniref:Sugar ABC transporter ATP-binding protein n=1 Tax=Winogradskya consettensis TaxID=113560 RepID=A0A919SPS6_9ACTN|nr:sugar ABC transporter ATP-binding protein [Actinoplanes consettensis]GIM76297.1 sugar ABC transporter ATP-binding protein [Actinoplanes consettensis]